MLHLHIRSARLLAVLLAVALFFPSVGCEQGYVGGPVAIVKGTSPEHGMLGVSFSDPPDTLVLDQVFAHGPAFQSGLQVGDEILAIGHQKVKSADGVLSVIRSTRPGDQLAVRVRRSADEMEVNVTLCDFATIVELKNADDSRRDREP